MGSKLEKGEPVPEGIRRVALRHADDALVLLGDPPPLGGTPQALRRAQRAVVQTRSVLALLRPALRDKRWKKVDRRLRRALPPLAEPLEAAETVEALDLLSEQYAEVLRPDPFSELEAHLVEHRTRSLWVAVEHEAALERAARQVARARAKIASADLTWENDEPLWLGPVRRSFKRSRRAMGDALDYGGPDDFRSWRKAARTLRHQLSTLDPIWAGHLDQASRLIHELTDLLDERHDLNGLACWIRDVPAVRSTARRRLESRTARGLVAGRIEEIREDVAFAGERLFARRPREVADRLHSLSDAWTAGR